MEWALECLVPFSLASDYPLVAWTHTPGHVSYLVFIGIQIFSGYSFLSGEIWKFSSKMVILLFDDSQELRMQSAYTLERKKCVDFNHVFWFGIRQKSPLFAGSRLAISYSVIPPSHATALSNEGQTASQQLSRIDIIPIASCSSRFFYHAPSSSHYNSNPLFTPFFCLLVMLN